MLNCFDTKRENISKRVREWFRLLIVCLINGRFDNRKLSKSSLESLIDMA